MPKPCERAATAWIKILGAIMKRIILGIFLLFTSSVVANTLSEIRQSGTIRVGVLEAQPPFSKFEDGKFEGFEIILAEALSKDMFGAKLGKIEFVPVKSSERLRVLEENKVDMVLATFTITNERKQAVDFTTPYFAVNIGVLTRTGDRIKTLSDLHGKPVIVESGTTAEAYFRKEGFEVVNCATANECYRMLKDNKGVGFAHDNLVVLAYAVIDSDTEVNIKNLGVSDFLGVAVQKGNKELLDFLNGELIKLSKEGFMKKTYNETIEPYYKGTAEKKYFLLDDLYSLF